MYVVWSQNARKLDDLNCMCDLKAFSLCTIHCSVIHWCPDQSTSSSLPFL
uniref:Uncharacterized protein n=1 Tax=Arundo donax TaxID=35708 RepID=A0A0A8Y5D0_ARUDO